MATRIHGLQEIKSLSSLHQARAQSNNRHVHLFRLGALELERTRRIREKQAAIERIADIDARLAEIGALISKLQETLGVMNVVASAGAGTPGPGMRGNGQAVRNARHVLYYGG